ncbi:hypothetical protein ACFPRL_03185 [Pseudoclavibacter helvolus]
MASLRLDEGCAPQPPRVQHRDDEDRCERPRWSVLAGHESLARNRFRRRPGSCRALPPRRQDPHPRR